jgi:16S rRNA (guanine527-N7)-methyltransferase
VAPKTLPDVWQRHFLDSAQLLPLAPPGAKSWLDLGSGAGFPGLVIAALGFAEVHLAESDQRKAAFMAEAARAMAVHPMFHVKRIEALKPEEIGPVDVISARALAPLADLFALAAPLSTDATTYIFPKGRQAEDELTAARQSWTMRSLDILPSRSDAEARIIRCTGLARR